MSHRHLGMDERNVIRRMKALGHSQAHIARCLDRHPATVGRELRRNANSDGRYLADVAQAKAQARRRSHIRRHRTGDEFLMAYVTRRLECRWSPEQISGHLREVGGRKWTDLRISHTTIYRWIWSCPQRSRRFRPYLRIAWKARRKPYGKPSKRGQIAGRVGIDARPAAVDERNRLGDWEGDTVVGRGRSGHVVTSVERASGYLVARRIEKATSKATKEALHDAMRRLPAAKRKTLTVDNGPEFSSHAQIARLLGLDVYSRRGVLGAPVALAM